jgi:transcription elongation factor S-II
VGKLRSHPTKEVSELAKEIVKKWKNEVELAKAGTKAPGIYLSLRFPPSRV